VKLETYTELTLVNSNLLASQTSYHSNWEGRTVGLKKPGQIIMLFPLNDAL